MIRVVGAQKDIGAIQNDAMGKLLSLVHLGMVLNCSYVWFERAVCSCKFIMGVQSVGGVGEKKMSNKKMGSDDGRENDEKYGSY